MVLYVSATNLVFVGDSQWLYFKTKIDCKALFFLLRMLIVHRNGQFCLHFRLKHNITMGILLMCTLNTYTELASMCA